MILGPAFENKHLEEFVLLTMKDGTFPLAEIRQRYRFLSEPDFINIVRDFAYRGIFKLDPGKKTIAFPKKLFLLIRFIRERDMLNALLGFDPKKGLPKKARGVIVDYEDFLRRVEGNNGYVFVAKEINRAIQSHYRVNVDFRDALDLLGVPISVKTGGNGHG